MEESKKIEIIGHYGGILSLIEVGLGSLLHSFHIPFAGIFLSLNQGYLLCRVAILTKGSDHWSTYTVSNVAAVLKSLSPAGQKLGPMLSLSMQGLLFNLGVLSFGTNAFGLSFGMLLLSFWSFVQPLITYYLFFGEKLFNAAVFLYEKTLPYHHLQSRYIKWIFIGVVVTKAVIAIILAIIAWKTKGATLYQERLLEMASKKENSINQSKLHPAILALKDLFRPLFIVSLIMTALFLFYGQHEKAQIGWYLMRPIAIGFFFFYISRTMTLDRWLIKLEGGRFQFFSKGCQVALIQVRKII